MRERVESKSEPVPEAGCWLWSGSLDHAGYGRSCFDGVEVSAHRLSYVAFNGPLNDGEFVCHKCDTPSCVNPDHLFAGTHQQNVDDMTKKRRHPFGERNGRAKIKQSDVAAIRADPRPQRQIARDYGVDQTTISKIKRRLNWAA